MYLGLDIGTTSVCAVLLDDRGRCAFTATEPNRFAHAEENGERTQEIEKILTLCENLYTRAKEHGAISSVGVSGQMHGILYVDENGKSLSPLYSWQDGKGNLPFENSTYAKTLSALSGYKIATGYGACTLFYDMKNGRIPQNAAAFCTVGDYIAMRLAQRKSPLLHPTNAASLGLFDIQNAAWDKKAINAAGLPERLFPCVSREVELLGKTVDGAHVYSAIGDNQASVYGSTKTDDFALVNVGTGSQISALSASFVSSPEFETRPYLNGKYLLLGCALCGGYSYKLLKDFFSSVLGKEMDYSTMNEWAKQSLDKDVPPFLPLFRGTRENPEKRACWTGISENDFNAQALTGAVLLGIADELYAFYDKIKSATGERKTLIASGNGVRLNPVLQEIIKRQYALPLHIPKHKEEAAFGAALIAAETLENKSLKDFIRYE